MSDRCRRYDKIYGPFKRDTEEGSPTRGQVIEGDWFFDEFYVLKDHPWSFWEKVDGTNVRVFWDGHDVEFLGRRGELHPFPGLREHLQQAFQEEILEQFFGAQEVTLYGEGYGAGINKGGKYRQEKGFVLFDVRIGDFWIRKPDVEGMAVALGIPHVPLIAEDISLLDGIELVKAGVKSELMASGTGTDDYAEGLVGIPKGEFLARNGSRLCVKIKHSDFFAG